VISVSASQLSGHATETTKAEADKAIAAILQPLLEELQTAAPARFATEPDGAAGK